MSRSPSSSEALPAPPHRFAVVGALLVTVLWSSSWVLIRMGLDDEALPPLTFAGLRYGLAAVVLWVWVASSGRRRSQVRSLPAGSLRPLLMLGLVFYAVTQGAQFVAIDHQPAATSSLVLSTTSLFVGLISVRSLGEATSFRQFFGAGVVIVGAVVYFGGDLGASAVGMAAATVALGANVGGGVLGRAVNRSRELGALTVTTVAMSVGAVVLVVAGLVVEGWPQVSARGLIIVAWLAVVNTAVASTLWNWSLRSLTAVESSGLNSTMVVQIAVLAWVFLDEYPGVLGLAGVATVSVGIVLTQRRGPDAGDPALDSAPSRVRAVARAVGRFRPKE